MSLSKTADRHISGPKCSRCRHHGIIVPQKGHGKSCPFLKCDCCKCYLITQRTQLTALLRNLKRAQDKTADLGQRPSAHIAVKRAAEGACCSSTPDGGATTPLLDGAPERADTSTWYPADLRSGLADVRENVAALDNGKVLIASGGKESCRPIPTYAPHFSESGQTAAPPVFPFPFRMPGQQPSSFMPCPNFLLNMPAFLPLSAGLYNNDLCGTLMFPHLQSGAPHHPPPPHHGPPADFRQVFFTLQPPPPPEPVQEELTSMLHPQPPLSIEAKEEVD